MSEPIIPPGKHIALDPHTGDYAAYYDGELLGYRPTRPEAQALADQHAYNRLCRGRALLVGDRAAEAE